ncbi:MAG TPA: MlaD family protein [Chitinophagaceae bacterium]|jgi:phospholipid/cholesterol/gamma-HCH transport system substrate-binding protein|nr:MlaD family protein [Chitinophagaceae bacterium]
MKINNEAKIGILSVLAIALLILGFNYLKGRSMFNKSTKMYAVFHSVSGLSTSNPVIINGLQIGTVYEMIEKDPSLDSIVVTINLDKEDIRIPVNSLAYINKDLLGTSSLSIELGNSRQLVKNGDTLNTAVNTGLIEDVKASLNPALNNVNGTLKSLDSVIEVIGVIFDPATKFNIQKIVTNLTTSSASLQALLNSQTGALAKTLNNLNQLTGNLANQNATINRTLGNLDTATGNFARLNLDSTILNLNNTITQLNGIVTKANSSDGSLGMLLQDKKLYQNLENTSRSLNILVDDLRVHPKRYVTISVFGKKDKGNYLTNPLIDSTNTGSQ